MNWKPDTRILEFIKEQGPLSCVGALCCCPDPIARQAASLIYYQAEVCYCATRPGYTPPRLIQGNSIGNVFAWQASTSDVIQAHTDMSWDLDGYDCTRDPKLLASLQRHCADGLARCNLQEVPGIMEAFRAFGLLPER